MRKFRVEFEIYIKDNDFEFGGKSTKKVFPRIRQDIIDDLKSACGYHITKGSIKVMKAKQS